MAKALELTGLRFNKITVLAKSSERTRDGQVLWKCECDCGEIKLIRASSLKSGNSQSCGCSIGKNLYKHGLYKHRLMRIWVAMKQRCYNPNTKAFKTYGARGIQVCDEWKSGFKLFYEWAVNNGYSDNLEIDRINTYGNYEPENCRWITHADNTKNTMIQSNSTSGYIGVSKLKDGRYRVYYTLNGKRKQIGIANTALEGSQMREVYFYKHKIGLRNGI